MVNENSIPLVSLKEMLFALGDDWHSSEYFISADEVLPEDPQCLSFRPDFYGLFLCVEGWLDIKINNQLVHVEPYCIFTAGPDSIFQRSVQSPDCKGQVVFFTKDFLLQNIVNTHQLETFRVFTRNDISCIRLKKKDTEPLLQLYDILKNKREIVNVHYYNEIIRSLFMAYLYEAAIIYQKGKPITQPRYSRDAELNFKFQELLAQHDKMQHNLKFYADSLFITPKYLIHAIKNASGRSPGKLIDEAILAEAKLLLINTSRSIASIADELHFSDTASFSKFFKKHTGSNPLYYRRQRTLVLHEDSLVT
jgi:AraC-like DNA-binding protein